MEAKEEVCIDINSAISDLWSSIEIIFEQEKLLEKAKATIEDKRRVGK